MPLLEVMPDQRKQRTRKNLDNELRFAIGMKLKQAREALGLTQEQVAERIGVTRNMVNLWEAGTSFPMPERLGRIAKLYGISLDWLLGKAEKPAMPKRGREHYIPGEDALLEETELVLKSSGDLSEQDIQSILDYVRFVKERKQKGQAL